MLNLRKIVFDQQSAPKTRFDDSVSPHRVLAPFTFDLSALERVRAALADATLNDMIFAICSGALRRYLVDKNELPERSLYALVPLHVHDRDDEGVPGHRVQLIRIGLMTHVDDPLERLAMIREEMQEAREAMAEYVKAGEAYMECVKPHPFVHNYFVDRLVTAAEDFNEERERFIRREAVAAN